MVANEKWFTGATSGASAFYSHQIEQSVRFEKDAGDKLARTPSSSGNRRTFTISFWLKRTQITHSGGHMVMFGADDGGGSNFFHLRLGNDDTFRIVSSGSFQWIFTPLFRDVSGWGHFLVAIDTTAGGQDNQVKFYFNGTQVTSTSLKMGPSSSYQTQVNHTTAQEIGVLAYASTSAFAGYLADFVLIDGTAYGPDSFGESKNGVWIPKDPSGLTFGTNGVYFKFQSASALGDDSSGNNNDYSVTNMGTDHQVLDSPTFGS